MNEQVNITLGGTPDEQNALREHEAYRLISEQLAFQPDWHAQGFGWASSIPSILDSLKMDTRVYSHDNGSSVTLHCDGSNRYNIIKRMITTGQEPQEWPVINFKSAPDPDALKVVTGEIDLYTRYTTVPYDKAYVLWLMYWLWSLGDECMSDYKNVVGDMMPLPVAKEWASKRAIFAMVSSPTNWPYYLTHKVIRRYPCQLHGHHDQPASEIIGCSDYPWGDNKFTIESYDKAPHSIFYAGMGGVMLAASNHWDWRDTFFVSPHPVDYMSMKLNAHLFTPQYTLLKDGCYDQVYDDAPDMVAAWEQNQLARNLFAPHGTNPVHC